MMQKNSQNPWKRHQNFFVFFWTLQTMVMTYVTYRTTVEAVRSRGMLGHTFVELVRWVTYMFDTTLIAQMVAFRYNCLSFNATITMQVLESIYWTAAFVVFWGLSQSIMDSAVPYQVFIVAEVFYATLIKAVLIYRDERIGYEEIEVPTFEDDPMA